MKKELTPYGVGSFSFHLQRSSPKSSLTERSTYLVRISAPAPCGRNRRGDITWESKELPLETLLELFYNIIDPTSLNKQGLDEGTQYRTGIYTVDDADLAVARRSLEKLQTRFDKPVVVECQPLDCFYTAEEYHQKYLDRNPNGYCHVSLGMIQKAKAWKPGDPTTL